MTTSTQTDLADRIEALTQPCRETDAEIALAAFGGELIWQQQNYTMDQHPVRKFPSKNHVGGFAHDPVESYTGSIDAAMSLCPEGREIEILLDAINNNVDGSWLEALPRYIASAAIRASFADKERHNGTE